MQSTEPGRIYFPGNPWPEGHAIKSLRWGASIHPEKGLLLHFELESEDYYAADGTHLSDNEDLEGKSDWQCKTAWNNFHACRISESQTHSAGGILVSDGQTPFVFGEAQYQLQADPLPVDWERFFESNAFGIYLLGHDAVADHQIHLQRTSEDGVYRLDWSGRIALAYVGESDFRYTFHAHQQGVKFDSICLWYFDADIAREQLGLEIDPSLTPRDYLAPYVSDPDNFRFERRNEVLYAQRITP